MTRLKVLERLVANALSLVWYITLQTPLESVPLFIAPSLLAGDICLPAVSIAPSRVGTWLHSTRAPVKAFSVV